MMTLIHAQHNYQERIVYYSERDNVCQSGGFFADTIRLMLKIESSPASKKAMLGYTICADTIYDYNAIFVTDGALYSNRDLNDYIEFEQESRKVFHRDYLINIVAKLSHTDDNAC